MSKRIKPTISDAPSSCEFPVSLSAPTGVDKSVLEQDQCAVRVSFPLRMPDAPAHLPALQPPRDPAAEAVVVDLSSYAPAAAAASIAILAREGPTVAAYADASSLAAVHDVLVSRVKDDLFDVVSFVFVIFQDTSDAVLRVWRPDRAIDVLLEGVFGQGPSELRTLRSVFEEAVWARIRGSLASPHCLRELLVCQGLHTDKTRFEVCCDETSCEGAVVTCTIPPPTGPRYVKYVSRFCAFLCATCEDQRRPVTRTDLCFEVDTLDDSPPDHNVNDADDVCSFSISSESETCLETCRQAASYAPHDSQANANATAHSTFDMFTDNPSSSQGDFVALRNCETDSVNSCEGSAITLEATEELLSDINCALSAPALESGG